MSDTARLRARPGSAPASPLEPGLHELGVGRGRDGLLYVPDRPAGGGADPRALVVMLHGAGSTARRGIEPLLLLADGAGLVLLAPDARGPTWDVIRGGYGPDVAFIDDALAATFERVAVDPRRVAVGGFSDGASYALSIGIPNGDLFEAVVAFSPGFLAPPGRVGSPRLFVSHGRADPVLPIDRCSRLLVPALRDAGYQVTYRDFDGGHAVPPEIAAAAAAWLTRGAAGAGGAGPSGGGAGAS